MQTIQYMRLNQKKATIGSAGYDLFAAEEKTLSPKCVMPITTDIEMEIPYSYFGKIYPRSGFLRKNFVSCDGGVIDSDFRGTVLIFMTNNDNEPFEVKHSKRIGQFYTKKKRLRLQKLNL